MQKQEPILIRPSEAADLLSMSRSSVYELIASGEIPSVRIGGMLRVPMAAIRKLIEASTNGAGAGGRQA